MNLSLNVCRYPESPTSTSGYISFLENVTAANGAGSSSNGSVVTTVMNGATRHYSGTWFKRNSLTASSAASGGYISARRYVMMPGKDPDFSKRRLPEFGSNL
jgi:hypothetical protein